MKKNIVNKISRITMTIIMMLSILGTMAPYALAAVVNVYKNGNGISNSIGEIPGFEEYGNGMTPDQYARNGVMTGVEVVEELQARDADYSGNEASRNTLNSYYSVMCCGRGIPLTAGTAVNNISGINDGYDIKEPSDLDVNFNNVTDGGVLKDVYYEDNYATNEAFFANTNADETYRELTNAVYESKVQESNVVRIDHPDREHAPLETWIICNLTKNCAIGHGSPQQLAWWSTPTGHFTGGQDGEHNEYYRSGVEFEGYVNALDPSWKLRDKEEIKYVVDGKTYSYRGYDLQVPTWNTTTPTVSYNTEGQYYLIGPYSMNYIVKHDDNLDIDFADISYARIKTDKSDGYIDLAAGNDWELINAQGKSCTKVPTTAEFNNSNFPKPDTEFYVKIYNRGKCADIKKLQDFRIGFKYINAEASFDLLTSRYSTASWSWVTEELLDENNKPVIRDGEKVYRHYLKATITHGKENQPLTTDAHGAYWYENYELRRNLGVNSANINIIKQIVDDNGNVINNPELEEKTFKFDLEVKNAYSMDKKEPSKERINVTVGKDGQSSASVKSNEYYWLSNDNEVIGYIIDGKEYHEVESKDKPTFTLKEVLDANDGSQLISAELVEADGKVKPLEIKDGAITGDLTGGTVNIRFKNTIAPKQGYLRVMKQIEKPSAEYSDDLIQKINGKEFTFKAKISGDFVYNNKNYSKNGEPLELETTAKVMIVKTNEEGKYCIQSEYAYFNDDKSPIYWYTKTAPTYTIEEIADESGLTIFGEDTTGSEENASEVKYIKSGTLLGTIVDIENGKKVPRMIEKSKDGNVTNISTQLFKNKFSVKHSAPLKIIKKFDASAFTEEERKLMLAEIKKLTFTFGVKVGETTRNDIILNGNTAELKDGIIEIVGQSTEDYTWIMGDAPAYEITEKDVPKGTTFDRDLTGRALQEGQELIDNGDGIKGYLREAGDSTVTIDNNIYNKCLEKHEGRLELEKLLGDEEDTESKEILSGKEFYFNLDIKKSEGFIYVEAGKADKDGKTVTNIRVGKNGEPIDLLESGEPAQDQKDNRIMIKPVVNEDPTQGTYAGDSNKFTKVGKIVWFGDEAPTYKVEEDLTSVGAATQEPQWVNGKEGVVQDLKDESGEPKTLTIQCKNAVKEDRFAKIKIYKNVKALESYSGDINKLVFKFKLVITDQIIDGENSIPDDKNKHEYNLTLTPQKNGDTYVWESEEISKSWNSAKYNSPKFVIEEIEIPDGVKFDNAWATIDGNNDSAISVDIEHRRLSGDLIGSKTELTEKDPVIVGLHYDNDTQGDQKTGRIKLIKKIREEDKDKLKGKTYSFKVKISEKNEDGGEFEYASKKYGKGDYYLDDEAGISTDESARVHITIPENGNVTQVEWTGSNDFKWNTDKNAPTYEIEETDINPDEIKVSWVNQTGSLANVSGGYATVECINSSVKVPKGELRIIKTFDATFDSLDEDTKNKIKKYVFKATVHVDGVAANYVVPLEYKAEANRWEGELKDIPINSESGEVKAKITETDIPADCELLSISPEYVTIKENETDVSKFTFNINQQYIKPEEGELLITKKVSSDSLKGEDFQFKVKLNGNFEYNDTKYDVNNPYDETVTVKGGETFTMSGIKWAKNENAPTYEVEEIQSNISTIESITNNKGTLSGHVEVIAVNKAKKKHGYIKLTKVVKADLGEDDPACTIQTDDTFEFEVALDRNGQKEIIANPVLSQNQVWVSDMIEWDEGNAPRYMITEVNFPDGYTLDPEVILGGEVAEAESPTSAEVTAVTFTNKKKVNKGKFKVDKTIITEKKLLDPTKLPEFDFKYTINGECYIINGETRSGTTTGTFTIKHKEGAAVDVYEPYESKEITWFGNDAPTVEIEEIESKETEGWVFLGVSHSGTTLVADETIEFVATNKLPVLTEEVLTIDMGGTVWEDIPYVDDKNNPIAEDGIMQPKENKVKNVEVYIYDEDGIAALTDESGAIINQPIYTDGNGKWSVEGISLPKAVTKKYYVQFLYDGQNYQPTKFLMTGNNEGMSNQEKSKAYNDASERKVYYNSSYALDKNREEVDNRIRKVYGNTSMDGSGRTLGLVDGVAGTNMVTYQANISDLDQVEIDNKDPYYTSLKSKLQTTDSDGRVYDLFKAAASTYNVFGADLRFPVANQISLIGTDRKITENGLVITYIKVGSQDLKHINLGLVKRPEAGAYVAKALNSASVVVRNNLVKYYFNGRKELSDLANLVGKLNDGTLSRTINVTEYDLDLYKPDYYYREEIYQSSPDYNIIKNSVKDTEMEVYLNYQIDIVNESEAYDMNIGKIYDYYDSSLELVEQSIKVDDKIKNVYINGKKTNPIESDDDIALGNKINYPADPYTNNESESLKWKNVEQNIKGSDGNTYNKMSLDLNTMLYAQELSTIERSKVQLFVTLKAKKQITQDVQKDGVIRNVVDSIATGNKSNIIEIASYSTYYRGSTKEEKKYAGKIDNDSAPDNINMTSYLERYWFEDDTYAAPKLLIELKGGEDKSLSGRAWEDNSVTKDNAGVGKYDVGDEAVIGGLTAEFVEKIKVGNDIYDFVWPTNKPLVSLNGHTVEEMTGFDSVTETSRNMVDKVDAGSYKFVGMASGDYVARYLYGIDKEKLPDTVGITGEPIALTKNGDLFNKGALDKSGNGSTDTLTANYNKENRNSTPAVYNGQDYKTTIYYDGNPQDENFNDARDDEARRLEVMAKSTTITNSQSEVLAEANKSNGNHEDLYNDYGMFADTNEMKYLPIPSDQKNNIDVGLTERPRNDIVLDKEIESIKITTNDDKVIFDAEYDIDYKVLESGSTNANGKTKMLSSFVRNGDVKELAVDVVLNKARSTNIDVMQELQKNENKVSKYNNIYDKLENIKNFRFINIDEDILQGSTITLNYRFTAINIGDDDYTTKEIADLMKTGFDEEGKVSQEQVLYKKAEDAKRAKYQVDSNYNPGTIIGDFYYEGLPKDFYNDKGEVAEKYAKGYAKVSTRVRQIVDYTDNDGVFDTSKNNTQDAYWKNTSVLELAGNGLDKNQLLSSSITATNMIYDDDERTYISDEKNNVALSVDVMNEKAELNNAGFEKELEPLKIEGTEAIDLGKTDPDGNMIYGDSISKLYFKVTRTVSSEDDADNLNFDNMAEVVKIMNAVGRRDIKVVSGNANPKFGEFEVATAERDTSATELVTFTPPTGIDPYKEMLNQILIATTAGLMIVGVGVIIIKRKM